MSYFVDFFRHKRDWYATHAAICLLKTNPTLPSSKNKQSQRDARIAALSPEYHRPITEKDSKILHAPIEELVQNVQQKITNPVDVLRAYGKVAVAAHAKTTCLTEVMFKEAEQWANTDVNLQGPLAGLPVSLKDSINVGGFDTSVGYSRNTFDPVPKDGVLVRLLKEAGAIPFVKTNLPITLLSFESTNDVWGRCRNPHNDKYSPGGSTGGEGALLAFGGSRIGIGSDVAGSVRAPAHFSGCYSLRCSTGRWPKAGVKTSMLGQEGIASVFSPMTRTLSDLAYFSREFVKLKPWRLDQSVHPIEWREDAAQEVRDQKRLKIGVMRTDGVIDPSPACARALQETVQALKQDGHEVFDVQPPDTYEAFKVASVLLNSDGCRTFRSFFRPGEWMDPGAGQLSRVMSLFRPVRYLWYLWVKYVRRDEVWAGLIGSWYEKSAFEQWQWVAKRDAYKQRFHEWWTEDAKMDFLLTPPNATPAVPHDGMRDAVSSCGYTFIFNLVCITSTNIVCAKSNGADI